MLRFGNNIFWMYIMKRLKRFLCGATCALMLVSCCGCGSPEIKGGSVMLEKNTIITDYSAKDVKLKGDFYDNALKKEIEYLLSLDNDKLLCNFRKNGGVSWGDAEPYNGWENSLIGGHTMGHYLTALAQGYVNASASSSDKTKLYEKMVAIVDGLAECQRDSGFLWGSTVLSVGNLEIQFDNVEKGKSNLFTEAWVPWYTMHKIFEGLISVYELAGYQPALDIVCKLGDWTYERTQKWDDATHKTVLSIEYGGMNDCLYDLYRLTGVEKYAVAAHAFDEDSLFELIRTDGANVLNNRHANTTIPKIIGALKRYEVLDGRKIGGKTVDASEYLETAEIFWQMVVDHHTYPTGGNSEWEHFGEDDILNRERTNCNCETCNVYNMLKFTKELFEVTGDKKYADYYEEAFINHILASQNPETGMTTYFQAMATGYFRTFSTPTDSFWCCTGTGMENFTKLGDGMYYRNGEKLYINMYIPSELKADDIGLALTQTGEIPQTDTAKFALKLDSEKNLAFMFRIPEWAKGAASVTVNGEAFTHEEENGYAKVERKWKSGDTVEVKIPLGFTCSNLQDGINTVSFKYGPVLLAAKLGDKDMKTTYTGMSVLIPETPVISDDTLVLNSGITPKMVKDAPDGYFTDNGNLSFTFTASKENYEFVPYYSLYNTRYGIFWKLAEDK